MPGSSPGMTAKISAYVCSRRSSLVAGAGVAVEDSSVCSRPAALPNEARSSVHARASPSPTSLAPWRSGSERSNTWRAASVERVRAVLHFLKARLQTRYQMGAERRGVNLERGKLTAQSIEIALELRPFLVRLGFASGRLIAELGRLLVFHLSPHSRGTGGQTGV